MRAAQSTKQLIKLFVFRINKSLPFCLKKRGGILSWGLNWGHNSNIYKIKPLKIINLNLPFEAA